MYKMVVCYRWWNGTGIAQRLPFVRDRIVESYYWTTGVVECRQHGYERIMLAKINALVATIDDIYDVYGTVEELRVFTNAIQRLVARFTIQMGVFSL